MSDFALSMAAILVAWAAEVLKSSKKTELPGVESGEVPGVRFALGKFSTRNKGFYEHLVETDEIVRHYVARSHPPRPLNVLLSAPPGSGKSTLVGQLLRRREGVPPVPLLELNISNIRTVSDLSVVWSFIRSMEGNGITPAVFLDEVDTQVEGRYLLKDLIMPMNDGAVVLQGGKLNLGPVVFIFAGSKLFEPTDVPSSPRTKAKAKPVSFAKWRREREAHVRAIGTRDAADPQVAREGAVDKIRDFIDRIDHLVTFPVAGVSYDGYDERAQELERFDLAMGLVKKHHSHVMYVEPLAAAALGQALLQGRSKRDAERHVITSVVPRDSVVFSHSHLPASARSLVGEKERKDLSDAYGNSVFRYPKTEDRP